MTARTNVVVVVSDTLRTAFIGAYGNDWVRTPHMDRLARQGTRFTRAHPESLPTIPTRRTLHTGRRAWARGRRTPECADQAISSTPSAEERRMSIFEDLRKYYDQAGIAAVGFRCGHRADCRGDCTDFTEAKEAFVGSEYEKGTLPRLLFVSLDSGSGQERPEERTLQAVRRGEELQSHVLCLPKNKHWYLTHEFAWRILQAFKDDLRLEDVARYFAHANSAKCCMNRKGRTQADQRLFRNCREYLAPEILLLLPDIIVTQGKQAEWALESGFGPPESLDCACPARSIDVGGRSVLWIAQYHPSYYRGFYRQRNQCWEPWVACAHSHVIGRSGRAAETVS